MRTFTDAAGRTWTIALNLGAAMAVRDKLGLDLLQPEAPRASDPDGPPLLTLLGTDELLLGEVICALLEPGFVAAGVTEQDVRASFDGRTMLAAQQAFYEELIGFFQSRGRADRAKAVATQMNLIQAAIQAIESRIDGIDPRKIVEEAIGPPPASAEAALAVPTSGARCGSSREASGSGPPTSRP